MAVTAAKLDPNAFYDPSGLCQALGLRRGSIQRARKDGRLRYTREGGRILIRGDWVEHWLTGDEQAATAGSVGA